MKDLDFDELDKAVNSLVAQNQTKPQSVKPPAPLDATESSAPTSNTVSVAMGATSKPVSRVPQPTPRPSAIAPPRSGRLAPRPGGSKIVDIVAPKARPAPSRTAATLKPTTTSIIPEPSTAPKPTPVAPEAPKPRAPTPIQSAPELQENSEALAVIRDELPAQAAELSPKPDESLLKAPSAEQWPDPLDFAEHGGVANVGPTRSESLAAEEPREPQSPFLPDAKVEKRPLGAGLVSPITSPPPSPRAEATPPAPTGSVTSEAAEALEPEVIAAEASEGLTEPESESMSPVKTPTIPAPEPEPVPTPEELPPAPQSQILQQQVRDTARASIPQQYRTPEKSVDNAPRPVFDTKEYHPPLLEATAHGHRSGVWGKLFIVLLILMVLAVGGYFAFMYFVQAN